MQKVLFSQKWLIFLSGAIALVLFIGFSYIVHKGVFINFDFATTVRLQDHISHRFDSIFSFFSDIGKFEIVTIFLAIACGVYCWIHRKWLVFLAAFFFYGIMHLVEIYGKTFVHHLPPPHFMLRTHDVFNFPQFYVEQTNSYPSGHAGRALFITAFLGLMVGRSKKISRVQKMFIYLFIALYDITMLTSRVYLGEHWTSDIIGGSLLGLACGFFGAFFL